ncbi:MAG: hypothetical protein FWG62_05515 [Proteobacteria bacterium]|nr:hypothetical protein [Pseudomonadota bacterium]
MTRLVALILLCLMVVVGGYLLAARPAPDIALVDYLPDDTLFYMEMAGPARLGMIRQWRFNQFGKTIPPATWYKFLQQAGESGALIAETRRVIAAWETFAHHPVIASLLGNGAAFALVPEQGGRTESFLFRQWLVALRIDDSGAEQRFGEIFAHLPSHQPINYQGKVLWHLVAGDGREFYYWRHRNVVLVTCEQALLKRCIDLNLQRMIRKGAAFSTNASYLRLHQLNKGSSADIFCYIDLEGLSGQAPLVQMIETESGGLLPRQIALCHRATSDTNRLEFSALVSPASAAAFLARHALPGPVRQPPLEPMVPEVKLALWTNWFKLEYLWDVARQKAGDDVSALMASIGKQLTEATGKSLDDFFDVFGGEFGVMMTEQQQAKHQSSRLLGGLLVAVRDRPAMAAMIAQMVTGLQVVKVKTGNLEIDSVILAGGLLRPSYALLKQHLVLADSVELVEAVQRQLAPGNLDCLPGKAMDHGDGLSNVSFFVRVGEVAEQLVPLLDLLARETGEKNRILSPEARQFAREIGLPLLAALHHVVTGRFRGYLVEDALHMEMEYTLRQD